MSTTQHYHFDVKMTCSGCSNAITRVLTRKAENSNINVDLETQSVDLNSTLSYDDVLKIIQKTGKEVLGGKIVQ